MKILIVEDDHEISNFIREGLDEAGYLTIVCRDGEGAFRLASKRWFSVILLDLMLPGMDGRTVCRKLRENGVTTPILMLTARDSVEDKVAGLEEGADDYLAKPFEFSELLARIRALLRRESSRKQAVVQIDNLVVDTTSRRVKRGDREIVLTGREYTLLEALATHAGQILSRQTILEHVWLDEHSVSNTVDAFIKNLRKKVDDGSGPKLIHTVYGLGYVLRTPEEAETA